MGGRRGERKRSCDVCSRQTYLTQFRSKGKLRHMQNDLVASFACETAEN